MRNITVDELKCSLGLLLRDRITDPGATSIDCDTTSAYRRLHVK